MDPRPGFAATQMGTTPVFNVLEIVDGDLLPATPVQPAYGLYDDGGVLTVLPSASSAWPSVDPLVPGRVWSNGLVVTASLPVTPGPSPQPVYVNEINSASLLASGANGITTTEPAAGSGQIWVNVAMGGELWVA